MLDGEPINLSYNPAANFQVSVASIPDWRGSISYRPNVIGPEVPPSDQRNVDTNFLDHSKVIAPTDPSQPFGQCREEDRPRICFLPDRLWIVESLLFASRNHEFAVSCGSVQSFQQNKLSANGPRVLKYL
jgi:hypothetical protein